MLKRKAFTSTTEQKIIALLWTRTRTTRCCKSRGRRMFFPQDAEVVSEERASRGQAIQQSAVLAIVAFSKELATDL